MAKLYTVFSLIICITLQAHSQNLVTEDFLYAPVDSLENSGKWYRSGLDFNNNIRVLAPGLVYKDYIGSGKGNSCLVSNSGEGDAVLQNFDSPIVSGAVYMAFMFQLDSLPITITEGYCIGFNPPTGTDHNSTLFIKRKSSNTFYLGIQKLGEEDIVYSNVIFELYKTYLVVLKYSFLPGVNNDLSSLYVFENGVPSIEPNIPMAFNNDGYDFVGQGSLVIYNNYAQSGLTGCKIRIDGIRVGTSWQTSVLAPISSTQSAANVPNVIQMECFPNPFYQSTIISYDIPRNGLVKISILNSSGVIVKNLFNDAKEAGTHELDFDASSLPAGLYHCAIQFNGMVIGKRIICLSQ